MKQFLTGLVLVGLVVGVVITAFVEAAAWLIDRFLSAIGLS